MSEVETENEMIEGVNHLNVEDPSDSRQDPIKALEDPEEDEVL